MTFLTLENATQEENGYSWIVEKPYKIKNLLLTQDNEDLLFVVYSCNITQAIQTNIPSSCDYVFDTTEFIFKKEMGILDKSLIKGLEIELVELV